MEEDSEHHTTFLTHMGYYCSRIMPQGDRNAPATIVQANNEIFKNMGSKYLVIHIDNIIIFLDTYDEHIAILQKVLQWLLDEMF